VVGPTVEAGVNGVKYVGTSLFNTIETILSPRK